MTGIGRRLRKEEDGYALVISVILLFVMMMLLVVGLQAGNSALNQAQRGIEWTRTLTVAESGVNDAMVRLSGDRSATSPCPTSGSTVCDAEGGEYQVDWLGSGSSVVITSTGYYPTLDTAEITRTVRVTLEPAPTFRYALFSEDFLEIKNNPVVTGDIYSQVGVDIGNNTTVCGSVVVANGTVTMGSNARVAKELALTGCSGKNGLVWVGGSIAGSNGVVIEGDAKASAPTGASCSSASTSYQIVGGSVLGNATACGRITSSVSGTTAGRREHGRSTRDPIARRTRSTLPTIPASTATRASPPATRPTPPPRPCRRPTPRSGRCARRCRATGRSGRRLRVRARW